MHPSGTRPKIRIQKPKPVINTHEVFPDESLNVTPERVPVRKVVTFCEKPMLIDGNDDQTHGRLRRSDSELITTKFTNPSRRSHPPISQPDRQKTRKAFVRRIGAKGSQKSQVPLKPLVNDGIDIDVVAKYGKPEVYSVLQVAEKILDLQVESFDKNKALKDKLESSEVLKRRVDEQASKKVNIPLSEVVFDDLVPLEFDENAFTTAVAEQREARLKSLVPPARIKDPEPSIAEFYTKDFQPEFVSIPTPNFVFPHSTQADVVPQSLSYTLYRHRRSWEGLPD